MKILITGAGGFIGGHLTKKLIEEGHLVTAVDKKDLTDWYQVHNNSHNITSDVSIANNCNVLTKTMDRVYNLSADMGGIGFIESNKAECMMTVLINTNLIDAARKNGVESYLYTSSACVYNAGKQDSSDVTALKEEDAYPAQSEDGYGWEKLFSERMCRHVMEDYGMKTHVARYHNVYGPYGTYEGGREKAPAAIIRKVIEAKLSGSHEIEIWGDGEQTRSFMYIDDCVRGTWELSNSNLHTPVNVGSSELVTINQLVDIAEEIAGIKVARNYNLDAPQGVRGRNSDNTLFHSTFGWEPSIALKDGMEKTYAWIYDKMTFDPLAWKKELA
jgi:nucleoside-diphosphate-sugar epimerase